jgi:hypothetical protein
MRKSQYAVGVPRTTHGYDSSPLRRYCTVGLKQVRHGFSITTLPCWPQKKDGVPTHTALERRRQPSQPLIQRGGKELSGWPSVVCDESSESCLVGLDFAFPVLLGFACLVAG